MSRTRSPTTVALFTLPLLLMLAAAALGVLSRGGFGGGSGADDGRPLALAPVEAPDAAGPACAGLLSALPAELPADPGPLPRRALAEPAPPGTAAWAASERVVLRCGLPKPAELVPGAALLQVNGVVWLTLSEPDRDTFVSADRPVYVGLTVPRGLGTGPVQTVSDVLRAVVPTG